MIRFLLKEGYIYAKRKQSSNCLYWLNFRNEKD